MRLVTPGQLPGHAAAHRAAAPAVVQLERPHPAHRRAVLRVAAPEGMPVAAAVRAACDGPSESMSLLPSTSACGRTHTLRRATEALVTASAVAARRIAASAAEAVTAIGAWPRRHSPRLAAAARIVREGERAHNVDWLVPFWSGAGVEASRLPLRRNVRRAKLGRYETRKRLSGAIAAHPCGIVLWLPRVAHT